MIKSGKNIIWLASYPKSGNTWLRVLISNLMSESNEPVNINDIKRTPIASSRSIFDSIAGANSSDLSNQEIENLRPEVFHQLAENSNEQLFLKVHDAWKLTTNGKPMFPEDVSGGVIYIIRNPLDVAVSFGFHSSIKPEKMLENLNNKSYAISGGKLKLKDQLQQILSSWSSHVKRWTVDSKLPCFVIRYEDMLDKPLSTFKGVVDFIGMDYSDQEIKTALEFSNFNILKEQEENAGFKEKPITANAFFRKGAYNQWKEHFSRETAIEFYSLNKEMMDQYGYQV